ncbi:hypothetical protein K6V90_26095 [Cupriavidus pauculus]|uniref:hypothetical protein n=1 Tax=Cupriavidus pauculus TaxID=82633 RepID=UPI001C935E4D|nr:hypothetical protein [Cupriavidus pauculus]MBY4734016.1 hypothetical protein [Cupriavidus pauculus]
MRKSHELDRQDRLDATAAQLAALSEMISGAGFDSFRDHSENVQQGILWLVADLARRVKRLSSQHQETPR